MKKILVFMVAMMCSASYADVISKSDVSSDSLVSNDLEEVNVTSFYRASAPILGSVINSETINKINYGQEPSWVFSKMPSLILAMAISVFVVLTKLGLM